MLRSPFHANPSADVQVSDDNAAPSETLHEYDPSTAERLRPPPASQRAQLQRNPTAQPPEHGASRRSTDLLGLTVEPPEPWQRQVDASNAGPASIDNWLPPLPKARPTQALPASGRSQPAPTAEPQARAKQHAQPTATAQPRLQPGPEARLPIGSVGQARSLQQSPVAQHSVPAAVAHRPLPLGVQPTAGFESLGQGAKTQRQALSAELQSAAPQVTQSGFAGQHALRAQPEPSRTRAQSAEMTRSRPTQPVPSAEPTRTFAHGSGSMRAREIQAPPFAQTPEAASARSPQPKPALPAPSPVPPSTQSPQLLARRGTLSPSARAQNADAESHRLETTRSHSPEVTPARSTRTQSARTQSARSELTQVDIQIARLEMEVSRSRTQSPRSELTQSRPPQTESRPPLSAASQASSQSASVEVRVPRRVGGSESHAQWSAAVSAARAQTALTQSRPPQSAALTESRPPRSEGVEAVVPRSAAESEVHVALTDSRPPQTEAVVQARVIAVESELVEVGSLRSGAGVGPALDRAPGHDVEVDAPRLRLDSEGFASAPRSQFQQHEQTPASGFRRESTRVTEPLPVTMSRRAPWTRFARAALGGVVLGAVASVAVGYSSAWLPWLAREEHSPVLLTEEPLDLEHAPVLPRTEPSVAPAPPVRVEPVAQIEPKVVPPTAAEVTRPAGVRSEPARHETQPELKANVDESSTLAAAKPATPPRETDSSAVAVQSAPSAPPQIEPKSAPALTHRELAPALTGSAARGESAAVRASALRREADVATPAPSTLHRESESSASTVLDMPAHRQPEPSAPTPQVASAAPSEPVPSSALRFPEETASASKSSAPPSAAMAALEDALGPAPSAHSQPAASAPEPTPVAPSEEQPVLMIKPLAAAPSDAVPEQPSREQVRDTMLALHTSLSACAGDKHGTTFANVTVQGSGRVSYSLIDGAFAGTEAGSCMARALRAATFPSFAGPPFKVRYPLVF